MSMKWISGIAGGVVAYLMPTYWLFVICVLVVLYDSYTAYELSRRVKAQFPGTTSGKFKSSAFMKAVNKIKNILIMITLAYLVEDKVIIMADLYLPYIVSGIFIFAEAWSILENKSSQNGQRWARTLQKIMVDKTARHFDISPEELTNALRDEKTDCDCNDHADDCNCVQNK